MAKFYIFKGVNTQFYFRFNASNGEQILSSEGYTSKQNCINGIGAVKELSPFDSNYSRSDIPGNYRFNIIANNGQIVARSSEGYTAKHNRENAIDIVKYDARKAEVFDLTTVKSYG